MFKLARTFDNPVQPENSQRGYPAPGSGSQRAAKVVPVSTDHVRWSMPEEKQTLGRRTFGLSNRDVQTMHPDTGGPTQRVRGELTEHPQLFAEVFPGGVYQNYTPYFDRGAAAFVPNFGYVLTNPIGAGIAVRNRPQASYGPAAEYHNGAIWWTSQSIPTSVPLIGLNDPAELEALLGQVNIQAVVRTTG